MFPDWKGKTVGHNNRLLTKVRGYSYVLLVVLFLRVLTHVLQYGYADSTEFQSLSLKDEGRNFCGRLSGSLVPRTRRSSKKR